MRTRNARNINKAILCCDSESLSIDRAETDAEGTAGDDGVPAVSSRSEDLDGAFQRLPDTPGQRYADEGPEQRGLGVKSAKSDAVGARRSRATCARRCGLQLGDLGVAHVPL